MSPVFVKHCIQTMEQTAKGAEKRRLGVAPDFDFTLPPGLYARPDGVWVRV